MEQIILALLLRSVLCLTDIKVGVILINGSGTPYDYMRTIAAVDSAVETVNRDFLDQNSYRLVSVVKTYGPKCDASAAPGIAAALYYKDKVDAFLGPGCTDALDPVARMAAYWNLPIITGLGDSRRFRDKTDFSTLTRMAYCQCRLRSVIGSVFAHFNWTDISLLIDRSDYHSDILGESLDEGLRENGYFPNVIKFYSAHDHFGDILQRAADKSRVIVLSVKGETVRDILVKAHQMGYIQTGEFVFFDVVLFKFYSYWGDPSWERGDQYDAIAREAYEALLQVSLLEPSGPDYERWSGEVKQRAKVYGFDYDAHHEKVNFFVGTFHDGLVHYGRSVNESIALGWDYRDGLLMKALLWNRSFIGETGHIVIDDNGDRDTTYVINDFDPVSGTFVPVAHYWGDRPGYDPIPGKSIHWSGGSTVPPLNEPLCGFRGEKLACQITRISPTMISLIAVLCSVLTFGFTGFLVYRKFKTEAHLRDLSWIVNNEQIQSAKKDQNSQYSKISVGTLGTLHRLDSDQVFTEIGLYKGMVIAIRKIQRSTPLTLNRRILLEVSKRRSLVHDNVVRFVGAVLETAEIKVLHDYCAKGSLQDILTNDQIKLDQDFKRSLMMDIVKAGIRFWTIAVVQRIITPALHLYISKRHQTQGLRGQDALQTLFRGMLYIHNSDVQFHGRLKSSNCVVDSRFVLKITDFGLPSLYTTENTSYDSDMKDHRQYEALLWHAPELLRATDVVEGTQKGDVFSFAIIMEEIIMRGGPYDHFRDDFSAKEIVMKVKKGGPEPLRPFIPSDACPPELRTLVGKCWSEDPTQRPGFDVIKSQLGKIHGGKERSLLESLLSRMEQYANNLESLVAERTSQLAQEQEKTEQLLLQILPKTIAEQLKRGQHVQPETYHSVTIYFSDIVGFTTLSAESSPLQVVQLLNDLYTTFDSTLEKYDVYKVETIGDAYMVASGLPITNGNKHAHEIACMSLELLDSITRFRIAHRPHEQLKLRIGLHSGPCVAGVVGLKMPRYCLFGDTVNTASRMESHGEAFKIHISPDTKKLLDSFGSFTFQSRGFITVKGKGEMFTYWLVDGRRQSP